MTSPQIQIEMVPVLQESMLTTLKEQGFTISDEKFDLTSCQRYYNVYNFGKIVKRIIFEKDGRNFIVNDK